MEQRAVKIKSCEMHMEGVLELPRQAIGMVLLAHPSDNGRSEPRNRQLVAQLGRAGIGTLQLDLLSERETRECQARYDIALLTHRLGKASDWLRQYGDTRLLPLGLFGASTGAAAALQLAAAPGSDIVAIVARGGRPDLAGAQALEQLRTPTLLIVGALDPEVLALNQRALESMPGDKRLVALSGAGHFFDGEMVVRAAATLAVSWFVDYFMAPMDWCD